MPIADWESRSVQANGQRIHLKIAGSFGPMVLLCHGFPESSYSWRHQIDALASAGYRAVAMDMRGYGRSSKPTEAVAYRITELGTLAIHGPSANRQVSHDRRRAATPVSSRSEVGGEAGDYSSQGGEAEAPR